MVGLQTLDLAIGVRVPASQPSAPTLAQAITFLLQTGFRLLRRFSTTVELDWFDDVMIEAGFVGTAAVFFLAPASLAISAAGLATLTSGKRTMNSLPFPSPALCT